MPCAPSLSAIGGISSDAGDQAAVDADDRTGDVGGALAGEEGDGVAIFLRAPVAANGYRGSALGGAFIDAAVFALGLGLVERPDTRGGYTAGQDDVGGDAVPRDFAGQRLGPAEQRRPEGVGDGKVRDRGDHAR